MRTLPHGRIENDGSHGFILLRGLVAMIAVVICFALVCASLAVVSRYSGRTLEQVTREIDSRNAEVMQAVRR